MRTAPHRTQLSRSPVVTDHPRSIEHLERWVRSLTEENEELLAERDQLKAMLNDAEPLPPEWRLTGTEAAVFRQLVRRRLSTKEAILEVVYQDSPDAPEIKIVDVFICKLRKKLGPFGITIETAWGQGYSLTAEVRARFAAKERAS